LKENMDNRERLDKAINFINDKLSDGWKVELISVAHFTSDEDKPAFMLEVVLEQE
jgi:hypothetical protein